jgi:hypothetical protein
MTESGLPPHPDRPPDTRMSTYRFYAWSAADQITAARDIVCASDECALELAAQLIEDGARTEVWQGARLVGQVAGRRGTDTP